MDNSLKIGAVSGLIAGIVLGILIEVFNNVSVSMGLYEPYWQPIGINNIGINIPLFGFWGIVLGIIYQKAYSVVPGKGLFKSLVYGFILYFIITIRIEIFDLAYGNIMMVVGHVFGGFFWWLSYGLVLGFLFEFLRSRYYLIKEESKVITYDMKSGVLPGAIAGFTGGLAASIFAVIGHITGYWGVPIGAEIISTIDYWMSQVGTHLFVNMLWGTIFGAIFPKVYDLVPGTKVKKGFYYGLIVFLITSFLVGTYVVTWLIFHNVWPLPIYWAGAFWLIGGFQAIVFGIVLGLLYRKPSE